MCPSPRTLSSSLPRMGERRRIQPQHAAAIASLLVPVAEIWTDGSLDRTSSVVLQLCCGENDTVVSGPVQAISSTCAELVGIAAGI
eukprot:3788033-Amphidinium_carterae.1